MPVVTVGTVAVRLVPADPYRTSLQIENRSSAATLYVDTGPPGGLTTANASIRIAPNETVQITLVEDGVRVQEEWSIISDSAGTPVAYFVGWKRGGEGGV